MAPRAAAAGASSSGEIVLESQHHVTNSSFHIQKRAGAAAPLDKDAKAAALAECTSNTVHLLKAIVKDTPETQYYRTELNKPVFKCVLGFARAIDKHSMQQVR